jgi:hypothetical protein
VGSTWKTHRLNKQTQAQSLLSWENLAEHSSVYFHTFSLSHCLGTTCMKFHACHPWPC